MGSFGSGDGAAADCDPGQLEQFEAKTSLRATVLLTCTLSLIGSGIIILSYLCYKEHRTRARSIIVHLSLCNIGQVVSNLVGIAADFNDHFRGNSTGTSHIVPFDVLHGNSASAMECVCTAQGFVTVYFSLCGMLWTVYLAVYLYLLILSVDRDYFTHCIVWVSYWFCYALPLLITVWLLLTRRLGYAPYSTPGYCGLVTRRPFQKHHCDPKRDVFGELMGYDIWVILTILLTVLFYTSALCYLRQQHKKQISDSANFWAAIQNIDYKFIAIPVAFTLLRVWSLVMDILFTYIGISVDQGREHLVMPMLFLIGIGNNAQGFIDAVIFVAFTPSIRAKFLELFLCYCCRERKAPRKPSLLYEESKNYYHNNLKNYGPRYSPYSSSPVTIASTRISASPEPSTSYQESPDHTYTIQTEEYGNTYEYY